jgi:DNA-binding transcriptional regulator YbjK
MSPASPRLPRGELRRAMLIDAAITVIAEQGLESLSHRRVAAAAGVPPASTTYHFASLDELRSEALARIACRDLASMKERFAGLTDASDLAYVLGTLVHEWLLDREAAVVTIEVAAAALRRESVREIAQPWQQAWIDEMEPLVGKTAALATFAVATGYIQLVLLSGEPPSAESAIALMRHVLADHA